MRTAILWANLTGSTNACFRALAEASRSPIFVAYQSPRADAPFEERQFAWQAKVYRFETKPDEESLLSAVRAFNPDLLLVTSWNIAAYRRVCRELCGLAVRVCCMDNQWSGRAKQWLGIITAPIFVRRMFDVAFVCGERQAVFARKFGFREEQIWRGMYSCDHEKFHSAAVNSSHIPRELAFLYVGRLTKEKAVDVLIDAYRRYRAQATDPWPLWVVGTGPLAEVLRCQPGIVCSGFVQPDELPPIFARAAAFVLPSRFEPWGVVIHEATAAGLPVICTERCGAAVHLVQDGYNGFITSANDADALARALTRVSNATPEMRQAMSEASVAMSWQFTPQRWAAYVLERAAEIAGSASRCQVRATNRCASRY
jgi:glycosyltransferase involved in cell wall biosynthesis